MTTKCHFRPATGQRHWWIIEDQNGNMLCQTRGTRADAKRRCYEVERERNARPALTDAEQISVWMSEDAQLHDPIRRDH